MICKPPKTYIYVIAISEPVKYLCCIELTQLAMLPEEKKEHKICMYKNCIKFSVIQCFIDAKVDSKQI